MNIRNLFILLLSLAGTVLMPKGLYAQAPSNDNFVNADTLIIGAACTIGNNTSATIQNVTGSSEPMSPCTFGAAAFPKTVWYTFSTGNQPEEVSIKASFTASNTPVALSLYTWDGPDPNVLDPDDFCEVLCATVAVGKESSLDSLLLLPDETYYLQVTGPGGEFCIEVEDLSQSPIIPTNDDPCNAVTLVIGQSCNGLPNGDNTNATLECGEPRGSCYSGGDRTVWYQFVAPASGGVVVTTDVPVGGSLENTDITLYERNNPFCFLIETYSPISCDNNGGNNLQANGVITASGLIPGLTYYVQVTGGLDVSTGEDTRGTFCIEVKDLIPPDPGETACVPEPILADGTVFQFDNFLAAAESIDTLLPKPTLGLGNGTSSWKDTVIDASFWLSFEAPSTGHVFITTCTGGVGNTSFDTQIAVYEGTNCSDYSTFTLIAANDDLPGLCEISNERASELDLSCLTPGQQYYILVDGFLGQVGDFSISATPLPGGSPSVTAISFPPGCVGGNDGYILTGVTGGSAPYSYVWNNSDTTPARYDLAEGSYTLTVTDGCDSTTSTSVTVGPPTSLSLSLGEGADFCAPEDSLTIGDGLEVSGGSIVETDRVFVIDRFNDTITLFQHSPVQVETTVRSENNGLTELQRVVAGDFEATGTEMFLLTNEFTLDTNQVTIVAINRLWKLQLPAGDTAFVGRIYTPEKTRLTGLAFHPVEEVFYAIGYDFQTDGGLLYELDFVGGDTIEAINEVSLDIDFPAYLAIEQDGGFITQGINTQSIHSLDPQAGTSTVIGGLPFRTDFFSQDADIDPNTGKLYIQTYNTRDEHPDLLLYDLVLGEGYVVPGYESLRIGGAIGIQENLSDYTYSWDIPTGIGVNDPDLPQPNIFFDQSGAYTLNLTVTDGCGNSEMASVSYGASVGFAISLDSTDESGNGVGDGLVVAEVSGGVPPYTFDWSDGTSNTQQAARDSISSLSGGAYSVVVTDALGCVVEDATSVLTSILGTGLELSNFSLYPNPNEGRFSLEIDLNRATQLNASLMNGTGQQVWAKAYSEGAQIRDEIQLNALPQGVYILRIQGASGGLSKKVIIR